MASNSIRNTVGPAFPLPLPALRFVTGKPLAKLLQSGGRLNDGWSEPGRPEIIGGCLLSTLLASRVNRNTALSVIAMPVFWASFADQLV